MRKINLCVDCVRVIDRRSTRCKKCYGVTLRTLDHNKKCKCGKNIQPWSEECLSCHNRTQDRGLAKERNKFQQSKAWKELRLKAFIRDNHMCQDCNVEGLELQGHHIKQYKNNPELRLELSNIKTLCVGCHKTWHKENGR